MLVLVFIWIVFFFLVCGAVVFLTCLPLTPTRRYALSAALWCAVWGPCVCGLMTLAGLGLLATALAARPGDSSDVYVTKLISAFGWGYLTLGALLTVGMATTLAWLHQVIIKWLPFMLFRLYATLVVAGIGSVFGWCIGLWRLDAGSDGKLSLVAWLLAMIVLVVGFGFAAFKGASGLRTKHPEAQNEDAFASSRYAA